MSNYDKILHFFTQNNFEDDNYMRQADVLHLLNKLTRQNTKRQKFDLQVAKQLYENTPKNLTGDSTMVVDYVSTLCRALQILKKKLQDQTSQYQKTQNQLQKKQILLNIKQITQDIHVISQPFNLKIYQNTELIHKARNYSSNDLQRMNNSIQSVHSVQSNNSYRSIFQGQVDPNKQSSISLTIGIHVIIISILMQFLVLFMKFGFFNLLILFMALGIFIMNYFDRVYIQLIFYGMIISIVLDVIWFCFKFDNYWSPESQTIYGLNQNLFLKIVLIFTMVQASLRVFLTIILFKYRNNPHGIRKTVRFLCFQFDLNSNPIRNPITTKIVVMNLPKFMFN